jgi:hypothetical protein
MAGGINYKRIEDNTTIGRIFARDSTGIKERKKYADRMLRYLLTKLQQIPFRDRGIITLGTVHPASHAPDGLIGVIRVMVLLSLW